jgi:hypothetical protein
MSGATVAITVGGVDVTSLVIFESATFEGLNNAQPGVCEFTVHDADQSFDPVTGDEITLEVDGVLLWGGFLTYVTRAHPFQADLVPANPADYTKRYWVLRGADFNILFDKRVIRNTSDYLHSIPSVASTTMDGEVIRDLFASYIDVPAGFDTTTFVDDIIEISSNAGKPWAYMQQGTKLREQMENVTLRTGAVYYFDAGKNLHFHALETIESRWGFSDQPNFAAITTSPVEYQGSTYGFREVEAIEDGTGFVNDALVWGGSEWAGSGGTVVARVQDATSIADHGRWQLAETHFGEFGYGIQAGVTARANVIVSGPPGVGVGVGGALEQKGLRYPQWSYNFTWHDKDVPSISGTKIHVTPGQLVTIELATFGVTALLPMRSLRISFPEGNPSNNKTYVRFDGQFGIQLSDSFTLWRYLIKQGFRPTRAVATANPSSPTTPYNAIFTGAPTPSPNGSETVFFTTFGYIPGTTQVFKDGLLQTRGVDYTETDFETGEITFTTAPLTGAQLWVICRTLSG